jgi:hypothetical protein
LVLHGTTSFGLEYSRGDRPAKAERKAAAGCLKFSDPSLSVSRFIINFCKKTVYVSVIEINLETATKYCAVYGLLGNRYGKQYGPGEFYESNSLQASYDVDRALENCTYSGYETSGEGIGEFMRIVAD